MLLSIGGTQNISSHVATTLLQAHTTSAVTLTVFYLKTENITNNASVKNDMFMPTEHELH